MGPRERLWALLGGAFLIGVIAKRGSDLAVQVANVNNGGDNVNGPTFKAKLTTYFPSNDSQQEGGALGAAMWRGQAVTDPSTGARVVLPTVEDFRAGNSSYAAVSGDPAVFPWGQALRIDTMPDVLFRVVDTGGHFRGEPIYDGFEFARGKIRKFYRVIGQEPLDIAGAEGSSHAALGATVTIVAGDTWGGGDIDPSHLYGQSLGGSDEGTG